jgi:uncharacterized membrane protein
MKIESVLSASWQYSRRFFCDRVSVMITSMICWLCGWDSLNNFSAGLMVAGMWIIILGGFMGFWETNIACNPTYRYIQSVMPNTVSERTQQG